MTITTLSPREEALQRMGKGNKTPEKGGIVHIEKRENPYVQMDKRPLNDPSLTWEAKGLLAYLLSKPNKWTVRMTDLLNHAPNGIKSLRTIFKELEAAGYIVRTKKRDSKGHIEWITTVYEIPKQTSTPM